MLSRMSIFLVVLRLAMFLSVQATAQDRSLPAWEILGNPEYRAICYGGYRERTRDSVPSVAELTEDLKILSALGIKVVRTYNTQQYLHASNLLKAIEQMRRVDPKFEMYVMLGAWIDCKGAWTATVDHTGESLENNQAEIKAAVRLAQQYSDIVRVIAVGNEAMVRWAGYHVRPGVITKWANYLKNQREEGHISEKIWITTSDNFAAWGGGDASYHTDELRELIRAVDYVSMHTYPFHDSHHNPAYWIANSDEADTTRIQRARNAMKRAVAYAQKQYRDTKSFVATVDAAKQVHIGETGWASAANSLFGANGSGAADEFKAGLFYRDMRRWTDQANISCFYFEMFDEPWKDAANPEGPENHFGLIDIQGRAKFALWPEVKSGLFQGLARAGNPIRPTFGGAEAELFETIHDVPTQEPGIFLAKTANRKTGTRVSEDVLIVLGAKLPETKAITYPSSKVKLNVWEGTCDANLTDGEELVVTPGEGTWWGCAFEMQADGKGENLSEFTNGTLRFEAASSSQTKFAIGFQTGLWASNTQTNNFVTLNDGNYPLKTDWKSFSVPIQTLINNAAMEDVTSLLYLRGEQRVDSEPIRIRRVYYSRN